MRSAAVAACILAGGSPCVGATVAAYVPAVVVKSPLTRAEEVMRRSRAVSSRIRASGASWRRQSSMVALIRKGFTPMAARGLLGNAMYESGGGGRGGVYLDPPTDAFHYNWGTGDAAVGAMQFEGKRRYGFDPTSEIRSIIFGPSTMAPKLDRSRACKGHPLRRGGCGSRQFRI